MFGFFGQKKQEDGTEFLGDAMSQYELGHKYANGLGVPRDINRAFKLYLSAANKGHAESQFRVALISDGGKGMPQGNKAKEVAKWMTLAAEQDHAEAQYYLGGFYLGGVGVPKNTVEATKWFKRAALQGHVESISIVKQLVPGQ